MVLFVSPSISRSSSNCPYEVSSTCPTKSEPLPVRSVRYSPCNDQISSPPSLSSSTESMTSLFSNCSSRSFAEREAERMEKTKLLDLSLTKLRSNNNLPLRKHLLMFNGVKKLQRELDLMDDEDLYLNLIGGDAMEVDERRWLAPVAQAPPVAEPAPPSAEERQAPGSFDLEMDANSNYSWSWPSSGLGFFDCIQDMLIGSTSKSSPISSGTWSWCENSWGSSDPWAPMNGELSDSLSSLTSGGPYGSPFELPHLFPSQLLLQA